MRPKAEEWLLIIIASCVCAGCVQTKLTEPPRSAVEQLLLSTAADRAMHAANLAPFANQKVFVSTNYFEGYDSRYALGAVRDALSRAGALLVNNEDDAGIVVEPRSGALSIDAADTLVGIPSMGVPVPFAGAVSIPEIALYKSQKQFSMSKIALLAYAKDSGRHFLSTGPLIGRANMKYYKFLGYITYTSTDLPEKQPKKKHANFSDPDAGRGRRREVAPEPQHEAALTLPRANEP